MSQFKKTAITILLSISFLFLTTYEQRVSALSSDLSFVLLSQYEAELNIGEQLYVAAITSTGKQATWKSSDSKIASVNTYGIITAKKSGIALITAKIKNAEASCEVFVHKTEIKLNKTSASVEHGESVKLSATTSNGSQVTWKTNKKSIATVDEYGNVTGMKPGEAIITATADGSSITCSLTVKQPKVQLSQTAATLYRKNTVKLSATVSSGIKPTWKSNKKSVAIVDPDGTVTAIKNGTAVITATVDGVSQTCEITVLKPDITLSASELSIKTKDQATITAVISSGNTPVWSSSNTNVATVSTKGVVTAISEGKAYIYCVEDGTKVRCTVTVTE